MDNNKAPRQNNEILNAVLLISAIILGMWLLTFFIK